MTCPHILDWPDTGEIILLDGHEWCMYRVNVGLSCQRDLCRPANCPFDMGEWGAWRAVVMSIDDCLEHAKMVPYNESGYHTIHRPYEMLTAVGWSP